MKTIKENWKVALIVAAVALIITRPSPIFTYSSYWCGKHDLYFDAVNENLRETLEWMHGDSRKIFADEYIDDRSLLFIPGFADAERAELSGRMIDVVEDWLERKGAATDDEAVIKGDGYDYLAEQFAVALGIHRDCTEE